MPQNKAKEQTLTHELLGGIDKGMKCFVYDKVSSLEHHVYIRLSDGRSYWVLPTEIKKL